MEPIHHHLVLEVAPLDHILVGKVMITSNKATSTDIEAGTGPRDECFLAPGNEHPEQLYGSKLPPPKLELSLRHGISFPHYYGTRDVRYRFSPTGHLDLMDFLTDFGASRASRLDVMARIIGMPGKVGVAGKDVGPLIHAGKLGEVQAYCLCDVVQTTGLFLRVQLLRGQLDRDGYRAAMTGLLAQIEEDERLHPVTEGADRARLLLEEEVR